MAAYNNGERASEKAERGECANGWIKGKTERERELATRKGVGKGANNQL